ncbi:hypothetical protein LDO31_18115 [Luteimonas sp. XNQY3]|nr:hypothetical protein [Luteimonas sp. XNQY3]MCD9008114.1 hypothetical protein [Luteimonas sp. XNQY3]
MKTNEVAPVNAAEDLVVLGQASVATLGDVGLAEFEGGAPISGISND